MRPRLPSPEIREQTGILPDCSTLSCLAFVWLTEQGISEINKTTKRANAFLDTMSRSV